MREARELETAAVGSVQDLLRAISAPSVRNIQVDRDLYEVRRVSASKATMQYETYAWSRSQLRMLFYSTQINLILEVSRWSK